MHKPMTQNYRPRYVANPVLCNVDEAESKLWDIR